MLSTCYQYNLKDNWFFFRSSLKLSLICFFKYDLPHIIARVVSTLVITDQVIKFFVVLFFYVLPCFLCSLLNLIKFCEGALETSFVIDLSLLIQMLQPYLDNLVAIFSILYSGFSDLKLFQFDLNFCFVDGESVNIKDLTVTDTDFKLNTINMMDNNNSDSSTSNINTELILNDPPHRINNPNDDEPTIREFNKVKHQFSKDFNVKQVIKRKILVTEIEYWADSIRAIRDDPKYGEGMRLAAFSTLLGIEHVYNYKDMESPNPKQTETTENSNSEENSTEEISSED